jgi:26S proteasome regulatory subunit N11
MKTLPVIMGETTQTLNNKHPPTIDSISPHLWFNADAISRYNRTLAEQGMFNMYLHKSAEEKIRKHALRFKTEKKEVLGLLLGDLLQYEQRVYTIIRDTVTTDLDASNIHVKFKKDSFPKLFERLDKLDYDYIICGWYHSHPGHTCFLSEEDISTQKRMFNQPHQVAVVIDPLNRQIESFKLKNDDTYEPHAFAIYWDDYQEPYGRTLQQEDTTLDNPNEVSK